MTIEETRKAIEVMQAYCEGKEIEFRRAGCRAWIWYGASAPDWTWSQLEYRVAPPEPMEVELWMAPDGTVFPAKGELYPSPHWVKKTFVEKMP